jgi:hypothetical protein
VINSKQPYSTVVLDALLGLFTECNPPDLPAGASPLTVNCDYIIGSVNPRPGKKSSFYFTDFFDEKIAGFAQSIADGANELPWSNPSNATKGIPGTYASVALNTAVPATDGIGDFDNQSIGTGVGTGVLTGVATPSSSDTELALLGVATQFGGTFTPDPGWNTYFSTALSQEITGPVTGSGTLLSSSNWAAAVAIFKMIGASVPTVLNTAGLGGAWSTVQTLTLAPGAVTSGNTVIAGVEIGHGPQPSGILVTDPDVPANVYTRVVQSLGNGCEMSYWVCRNVIGRAGFRVQFSAPTFLVSSATISAVEIQGGAEGIPSLPKSEELQALNFAFGIPSGVVPLGFQVEITGKQTSSDPSAILTCKLLNPSEDSPTRTFQLPSVEGTVTLGLPTDNWGLALSPALFNDPNFGVEIQASSPTVAATFDISAIKIKVFLSPNPAPDFNYLKTFAQDAGEITNLALDSNGILWGEDPINNPGALTELIDSIEPNTFAQSVTQSDREFIALSNLANGTDIPMTYNGRNFSRLSQVGPGAPPAAMSSQNGSNIVSITQHPAIALGTGPHDWLLVSASPQDIGSFGQPNTPGNVMTIIFASARTVPSYITAGTNIFLSGFPTINGNRVNNDATGVAAPKYYTVIQVGQAIAGQQSYDAITFQVNFNTFFNEMTPAGCMVQSTLATMTTAAQIPNLEVGSQFEVAGGTQAGYDNTWTVLQTPNASQLQITSTKLLNNVATYAFNLISGSAPVTGQFVTVSQTLNGNGIFNVAKGVIQSVSGSSFSIGIVGANVTAAAENGAGIIFGTIFVFDAFAIVGNSTGGTIVTSGTIGAGIRKVCVSFETENGYVTQPSPIGTVLIPEGASAIAISNIPIGPSNVVRRHIHLTAANGGNFFDIPQPVTVTDPSTGQVTIYTSTWINDNTTTNATLSFTDAILLEGLAVDVEGANLFETPELGSLVGLVAYTNRLFAIQEQNKVTNLLNYSFDGGVGVVQGNTNAGGGAGSANRTYPLGWVSDPTNGFGGSVVPSPIFGSAYQISNTTGSTQVQMGQIEQGAYQDEFQVPIIQSSTTYSVRVTASVAGNPSQGSLAIALFDPATQQNVGFFSIPLTTLTTEMAIYTGTLLVTPLSPVPTGLIIGLYAFQIQNGITITIDRIEVFPTEEPNLSTQVTASYINDFEAFDQVEGVIDTASENPQPVRAGFVYFDTLYLVKSHSLVATDISSNLPPSKWQVRTISNRVGTDSIYGVDSGEDWAVIAGQPGLFYFSGGQPIGLTREIQSLWNLINWKYGYTLWVKNDVVNQRILIGVPMKTQYVDANGVTQQNPWIPQGIIPDTSNPTTPNVVIDLNYKQVNTGVELADRPGIRLSSYTGQLIATDGSRKFSIWTIKAPCAAFLTQGDNTEPLFVGNSDETGKIYELADGFHEDDGAAIDQQWYTYGFAGAQKEQEIPIGTVRHLYELMTTLLDGVGSLQITVFPNTLDSPYEHDLLPNIDLPGAPDGETEIPVNELGQQLFVRFRTSTVGEWFSISRIKMFMSQDVWSPVRGRN